MKVKNLKSDTIFVLLGYTLRYASLLILIPYYSHTLGPDEYGLVLASMSLMSIVWMVGNYGFSLPASRELAAISDPHLINRTFTIQLVARFCILPIAAMTGVIFTVISPLLREHYLFALLGTTLGIGNSFNLGWYYQGMKRFKTSIFFEAMTYPINVALIICFVKNSNDGANALFCINASTWLSIILSHVYALKSSHMVSIKIFDIIMCIKNSFIFFVQSTSSSLTSSGFTYCLTIFSSPSEVAFFGSAERLSNLGTSLFLPFGQVFMPTICSLLHENKEAAISLVKKSISIEIFLGLFMLITAISTSLYIIPALLGENFKPSVSILNILCMSFPIYALTHSIGLYVFVPLHHEKQLIFSLLAGAIGGLITAFFGAYIWGAEGVAVARLLGDAISLLVLIGAAIRLKVASWVLNK